MNSSRATTAFARTRGSIDVVDFCLGIGEFSLRLCELFVCLRASVLPFCKAVLVFRHAVFIFRTPAIELCLGVDKCLTCGGKARGARFELGFRAFQFCTASGDAIIKRAPGILFDLGEFLFCARFGKGKRFIECRLKRGVHGRVDGSPTAALKTFVDGVYRVPELRSLGLLFEHGLKRL